VPLPGDSRRKRALIRMDRWALYAYSVVKRYSSLSDAVASRILKRL
jgi:hypothetical protein